MPNWCHNTLTVSGEADELQRFLEAARPTEDVLRSEYDTRWVVPAWVPPENHEQYLADLGEKPPFNEFVKQAVEQQPLSFASLVPEASDEELRALERYQPCTMCGAHGTLPENEEQAAERGAKWYEWMLPDVRKDRTCNVCHGTTEERVGSEGWYEWRLRHWGTKWDAAFGHGPMIAIGSHEMNVDATVEAQGATITPTVAVFKFDTAWSPPSPVVETASERFPELEFVLRYGEPGGGYAGEERYVAGVCVESEDLEVEEVLAPEEMWF